MSKIVYKSMLHYIWNSKFVRYDTISNEIQFIK